MKCKIESFRESTCVPYWIKIYYAENMEPPTKLLEQKDKESLFLAK